MAYSGDAVTSKNQRCPKNKGGILMFLKDIILKSVCYRQTDTANGGCYVR